VKSVLCLLCAKPVLVGVLALAAGTPGLGAQQSPDPARRGFELERRGNYAEAADAYREALKKKPGDPAALFGLERSLIALDKPADILPEARAAITASPGTGAFYGVALRAWAAADQPDSVRAVAARWAALDSTDETAYREWGAAAISRHDNAEARKAYETARERLRRPDALAGDLAAVLSEQHDWANAVREWATAVAKVNGYRSTAVAALSQAPENARPELLRTLGSQSSPPARWLEADLRVRWRDPLGGYQVLSANIPPDRGRAVEAISGFLDQVRDQNGPDARRAQALALVALADRTPGPGGPQLRLEAAQAFADAGDEATAKRLLSGVSTDPATAAGLTSGAATTLVGVLVKEGKVQDAERKLEELKPDLVSEDYLALRRTIAWGWVRAGKPERADAIVAADSSVEGLALAGRLQLFRGRLDSAEALLKLAGPYAGSREEATARTALLAMLQPMQLDSLPALGSALLAVERGDTTHALEQLDNVAESLPADQGASEIRLYAGRLAQSAGRNADAERLFRSAAVPDAKATAPAAQLALAQLLLETGRAKEATALLENMILGFPDSALIPQARRLLDQARGAVPET